MAPVKTTSKPKTAEQIIAEYNDVFKGDVGTLQGEQDLEVDSTVTPTVCPYRRVPFGYWHVVLDEKSSKLCTFDTPYGRYRWKRLPFGISVASEIFQKRLHEAMDRLDGLLTVHDDMVVYGEGETKEEAMADHDKNLKAFLQRCREQGVKLNKKKLKLRCTEIPYMAHLVTDKGLKPDPDKIQAVSNMPKPDDIKAVRRFCGFVNYLAKFLPHLAEVMEPLRQLTHKDVP